MDNRMRGKKKMNLAMLFTMAAMLGRQSVMRDTAVTRLSRAGTKNHRASCWSKPHQGAQECERRMRTDRGQCSTLKFVATLSGRSTVVEGVRIHF